MYVEKVKKGWTELENEIIKTNNCVYCGACAAFCANIKFNREKEIPIEDGSCKDVNTCRDGYGLCYNLCPKTEIDRISLSLLDKWVFGKKHDTILGHYIGIYSVKLTDKAREVIPGRAGPLTGLLWVAMKNGLIDASIITDKDENFSPFPVIAKNERDLFRCAGYKPSQSPTISLVGEAINKEFNDIAVVGTPCQIQALRKLQNHPIFDYEAYDLVSLAVGTFCFGTFHNQQLSELFRELDIRPNQIETIDSHQHNFKMQVKTNSTTKEIAFNYLYEKAIRNACFTCSDYTASFADISVGRVGSEQGWDTLIIRTKRGKQVFDLALDQGFIEIKALLKDDKEIVLDITRNKVEIVEIDSNVEHSPDIKSFIIRNQRITKAYRPGMFVMLWIPNVDFFPMSISNVEENMLEITVQKIGEGTTKLFELQKGDLIGIRGPYGNTFNYEDANNILVVGGGMGIAALTSLIEPLKKNKKNIFVSIGAKDEASLIFSERLIDLIPNTMCATEDGSVGKKCLVTDTIEDIIKKEKIDLIITCGPEVMMKRVLEIADTHKIEIQASLERKMKCGVGLCGSCCIGENNDVTVCKEGPVFNSPQLREFPQFGNYVK
ncbi:MAG: dihydroorotate dehydrogenase electron transfer subunit [Promethearchaeota archaeon]|jgi:dihydroorotate dehydrogenase electron transfer subunit